MILYLGFAAVALIGLIGAPPWVYSASCVWSSAAMGLLGTLGLLSSGPAGRFGFAFAAVAFTAAGFTLPSQLSTNIVGIFAAGGLVWGLAQRTRSRVSRVLAVLFTVLAGAWGVNEFSAGGEALVWSQGAVLLVALGCLCVAIAQHGTPRG